MKVGMPSEWHLVQSDAAETKTSWFLSTQNTRSTRSIFPYTHLIVWSPSKAKLINSDDIIKVILSQTLEIRNIRGRHHETRTFPTFDVWFFFSAWAL